MKFWIVTPSYNQLEWLKLCVASVADQIDANSQPSLANSSELKAEGLNGKAALSVHHHIQDACSSDGTVEFLAEYLANSKQLAANGYTFSYASAPDEGMYDAINRGWKRAPDDVDVIAHLNCDEQYLPNALKTIAEFMKNQPRADVVLADMIVVDKNGEYICHRRSLQPTSLTSRYCCGGFTATTFQRASITKDKKVFFDTSWRNFGDKVWYNELHKAGCQFGVCNEMVALFVDTGENLNWTEKGRRERCLYEDVFLGGRRMGTTIMARIMGLRRAIKEIVKTAPRSYALFKTGSSERISMPIVHPRGLWFKRW